MRSIGFRAALGFASLAGASAFAEAAGLLLLVPILRLVGVSEAGQAAPNGLGLEAAALLYVALVAAASWVIWARTVYGARLEKAFEATLRRSLHHAILGMEWAAFQRLKPSDLTQALTIGVTRASRMIQSSAHSFIASAQAMMMIVAGLWLSWPMTVLSIAMALILWVLGRAMTRRSARLGEAQGTVWRRVVADLSDDLAGLRIIKSFNAEDSRRARFASGIAAAQAQDESYAADSAAHRVFAQATAALGAALGLIGAVRYFGLGVAEALVLVLVFARLFHSLTKLQESYRQTAFLLPAYQEITALIAQCRAHAEQDAETGEFAPVLTQALYLDAVSAAHGSAARDAPLALQEISATIPAFQVTVMIGQSGAGKSTLADVILGLLSPITGHLRVDGRVIEPNLRRAWRGRTAYVPQEGFMLAESLADNLRLADPEADEPALWAALELAAMDQVVRQWPDGLSTILAERGQSMSGGERQRLALARALVRKPELLVLDEATNALDMTTEAQILDHLVRLKSQMTVVIIAHSPAVLRLADHVIALELGRLKGQGAPSALQPILAECFDRT